MPQQTVSGFSAPTPPLFHSTINEYLVFVVMKLTCDILASHPGEAWPHQFLSACASETVFFFTWAFAFHCGWGERLNLLTCVHHLLQLTVWLFSSLCVCVCVYNIVHRYIVCACVYNSVHRYLWRWWPAEIIKLWITHHVRDIHPEKWVAYNLSFY